VVDEGNNRVEKFNSAGTYLSQFGSAGSGNGQFTDPVGVAVDPSSHDVYVTDRATNRVQKFNSAGGYLLQLKGLGPRGEQGSAPYGVAVDPSSHDVYVADYNHNRVEKFNSAGAYLSQFGSAGSGNGQFSNPYGVAVDPSGDVYVTDYGNDRVEKFNPSGGYLSQFGSLGSGNGQFDRPFGVSVDPSSHDVYVADYGNARVEKFGLLPVLTVKLAGAGHGRVRGGGISCPGRCARAYAPGSLATLTATPSSGSKFAGWSGACTGTGACDVRMSAKKTVTATFKLLAPDTKITRAVVQAKDHKASFSFKTIGKASGFQCALVKTVAPPKKAPAPSYRACTSPKTYSNLKPGNYTFLVRALNATGPDPTPASTKFTI
jgi:DNA-binding beta-propeller fold protein YncE